MVRPHFASLHCESRILIKLKLILLSASVACMLLFWFTPCHSETNYELPPTTPYYLAMLNVSSDSDPLAHQSHAPYYFKALGNHPDLLKENTTQLQTAHLIFTVAIGYSTHDLRYFLESFSQTCGQSGNVALILFVKEAPEDWDDSRFPNVYLQGILDFINPAQRAKQTIPLVMLRYAIYLQFLQYLDLSPSSSSALSLNNPTDSPSYPPPFRHVLLVDARDTMFQQDPFQTVILDNFDLYFSLEDKTIGSSTANTKWMLNCYGEETLLAIQENIVVNGGMILGKYDSIKTYLEIILSEIRTHCPWEYGSDQCVITYLYYSGASILQEHSLTYTGIDTQGSVLAGNMAQNMSVICGNNSNICEQRVCNLSNQPYVIVHQYDRIPPFVELIKTQEQNCWPQAHPPIPTPIPAVNDVPKSKPRKKKT